MNRPMMARLRANNEYAKPTSAEVVPNASTSAFRIMLK